MLDIKYIKENPQEVVARLAMKGKEAQEEIAKILGAEVGTIKSRISRGRANLKKILKNGNFSPSSDV